MPKPVESSISAEQLRDASSNYLRCLRLPPSSKVLVITDRLPKTGDVDAHLQTRVNMSTMLRDQIGKDHQVSMIDFGENPTAEELHAETERALRELSQLGDDKDQVTVVYLGNDWKERRGIYQAADEFGKDHTVKFAGSLGFSTGDCRVMSQMGETQIEKITKANEYFEKFFEERPKGVFEIRTMDDNGEEHLLNLSYDTSQAPLESELGHFDSIHESSLGGYKNVKYINIPGGEKYGTPFPFKNSNGSFSAEGIVFTVKNGLLVHLEMDENVSFGSLTSSQQDLIKRTEAAQTLGDDMYGKFLPIAELGLGFYELAGIKTYSDSSTLSYEKSGPHIAFGHVAEVSTEEDEIAELSGKFQHADFVLDNAIIMWTKETYSADGYTQFYPPPIE